MVKKENEAELRVLQSTLAGIERDIVEVAESARYLLNTKKNYY